ARLTARLASACFDPPDEGGQLDDPPVLLSVASRHLPVEALQPGHRGILVTQMDVAGCQSTLAEHHLFVVGAALGGEFFDEMAIALCRRGVGAVLEAQFGELQARFDEVRPAWDRWVSRVASSAKRL